MTLTPETVGRYLAEHGFVESHTEVRARSLGGGVSNVVLAVEAGDERVVLKQPLPNLDVEDDWPADVERVHNEAAAARAYRDVIPADLGVRVPRVYLEDREEHVIVIEAAPDGASTWKAELLDGTVRPGVSERVGDVLGRVQSAIEGNDAVRSQFADDAPFVQLRIDPYHRTVARRHPDLAGAIEDEIDRILGVKRTLVHGDYSPKNVLLDPECGGLWILDFEVAHWGDPAFDPAFMLNHLFIKSVYNGDRQSAYLDAAMRFWRAYDDAVEWDRERDVVRELGILMLARVDGKSPVEYVRRESTKDELRTIARAAIEDPPSTVAGFRERLEAGR